MPAGRLHRRIWYSILAMGAALALPAQTLHRAPLSARYLDWVARHEPRGVPGVGGGPAQGGRWVPGYVPPPVDMSHVRGPVFSRALGGAAYPPSYDLRTLGGLTPVKDQGQYGTCWTFACTGSLESTLLMAGRGAFDLSEWNLAYFAYVPQNPSLLTDFTAGPAQFGEDPVFDQGGSDWMSTALLARGTGAVLDQDCPYRPGAYRPEPRPVGDLPNGREEARVPLAGALFLSNGDAPSNASDLKFALTHYGAAAISMDWEDGNFDPTWNTYRDTAATDASLNHEVCVVGWDDAFPASRFPAGNRPSAPGAWIVRNSWSRDWGEGGYFHLSYDSKVFDGTVFLGGTAATRRIYQYDPLGWCQSLGLGTDSACCANTFTAQADGQVTAVAFYTGAVNTAYELDLRTQVTGGPDTGVSDAGSHGVGPQQGTLRVPGYHVVQLARPVPVTQGSRFSVLMRLTTPGYLYPIPVQLPIPGYSDHATAHHARSFISADGATWSDLAPDCTGAAVCLKAMVEPAG